MKCVQHLAFGFQQILFEEVLREENMHAGESLEGTSIEFLQEKSISKSFCTVEVKEDWTQPINDFFLKEKLPEDEKLARKIRTTSARYVLVDDQL